MNVSLHFSGLDVCKFIMSLCVVAIHIASASNVDGGWPEYVDWLIRLAVPFFFICSGFLLQLKSPSIEIDKSSFFKKRAGKVFRLFVWWICIYFPLALYVYSNNGCSFFYNAVRYFGQLIISGDTVYAYPLWYLYSLSIVLLLFSYAVKNKVSEITIFCCFLIIELFNWVGRTTSVEHNAGLHQIFNIFYLVTNRTFGGGIYIMAGVLVAKYLNYIQQIKFAVIPLIISLILFVMGMPYWELFGGLTIFIISGVFHDIPSNIAINLRSSSMWIYYLHMYVIFFMILVCQYYNVRLKIDLAYVITLLIIVPLSFLLVRLGKMPNFRWLRRLIT